MPTASSRPLLTVRSAPKDLAASSRASARSMATMWLGEYILAPVMADSPTGPAPTTATVSPGCDLAVEDPDLVAGRQDVGQHQDLLVAHPLGHRVGRGVGEGNPDVLGLGAVDHVAEDPAAPAQALAEAALPAEPAARRRR